MEKWFNKQSQLVKILLLLIPGVNWVVEVLIRWPQFLAKNSIIRLILAIIATVPTGIAIELPHNTEAQVRSRSGLAIKKGIAVVNGIGTIDEDYRGEICVGLINHSKIDFVIQRGDRIAQMAIMEVLKPNIVMADDLSDTVRAAGGFGSTGVK